MERKVFEDQLYALEERFKAWDKDMRSLLANALGDDKITLVALDAQDNLPVVTVYDTWNDTTSNVEIKKVLLGESGTVMFEDVDGGIRSEDSISTSQGIYPLLAAVRDELKAREGIKI